MSIWGGSAATGTSQATDPVSSVNVDVNASVARSDLDVIQSNVDQISASLGSPTDPASSTGNVYERLNFLDSRLDQSIGNDLTDVNTILDVGGSSVLIAATSRNRYANAFDGDERSTIPAGVVDNSIHNTNPVTIREAFQDLDHAATNARVTLFGAPTAAYTVSVVAGSGGTNYNVGEQHTGGGLTVKVTGKGAGGELEEAIVVHSEPGFSVGDQVTLSASAGGTAAVVSIASLSGARRTTSGLGTMNCEIIKDNSSVKTALRQLDTEANSARSDIGALQDLTGFDNNPNVVQALNELQDEIGDVATIDVAGNENTSDVVGYANTLNGRIGALASYGDGTLTSTVDIALDLRTDVDANTTKADNNATKIGTDAINAELGDNLSAAVNANKTGITDIETALGTAVLTTDSSDVRAAINELDGSVDANTAAIGTVSDLQTGAATDLTGAANELQGLLNFDATSYPPMYLVLGEKDVVGGNGYAAGRTITGKDIYFKVIGAPSGSSIRWVAPGTTPGNEASSSYPEDSASSEAAGIMYDPHTETGALVADAIGATRYSISAAATTDSGVYQAFAILNGQVAAASNRLSVSVTSEPNNVIEKTPTNLSANETNGSIVTRASTELSGGEAAHNAMREGYTNTHVFDDDSLPVAVRVTNAGSGYMSDPAVTFSNNFAVDPEVEITRTGGEIALRLTYRGASNGTEVEVTFSAPAGAGGSTATGYVNMDGNGVASVVVLDAGSGYAAAPTLTFTNMAVAATATAALDGDKVASGVTIDTPGQRFGITIAGPIVGDTATAELVCSASSLHTWSSKRLFANSAAVRTHGPSSLRCEWLGYTESSAFKCIGYEVCWLFNNYRHHNYPEDAPQSVSLYASNAADPPFLTAGATLPDSSFGATGSWTLLDVRHHFAGRMRVYFSNDTAYKHYVLAVTRTHANANDDNRSKVQISSLKLFDVLALVG
jgi:hypothetical protein